MWKVIKPEDGVPIYAERHLIPRKDTWLPRIAAWFPVYLEGYGNMSDVYLEGRGESRFYIAMNANAIYKSVATHYMLCLNALRDRSLESIKRSQNPPLPIAARRTVYCNVRAREEAQKNDGVFGYVATKAILGIENETENTIDLRLTTGHVIRGLPTSRVCLEDQVRTANMFELDLLAKGITAAGGWVRV